MIYLINYKNEEGFVSTFTGWILGEDVQHILVAANVTRIGEGWEPNGEFKIKKSAILDVNQLTPKIQKPATLPN